MADPVQRATGSPDSSRWQIKMQFEIKRVGKAHSASLRKPFSESINVPTSQKEKQQEHPVASEHPIAQAIRWQTWLGLNRGSRAVDVVKEFGVSPSTVSLGFQLLKLDPAVREFLIGLKDAKAIRFFSRRRLLPLARLEEREQWKQFSQLRARWEKRRRFGARTTIRRLPAA
jgi:hypothetical protein